MALLTDDANIEVRQYHQLTIHHLPVRLTTALHKTALTRTIITKKITVNIEVGAFSSGSNSSDSSSSPCVGSSSSSSGFVLFLFWFFLSPHPALSGVSVRHLSLSVACVTRIVLSVSR